MESLEYIHDISRQDGGRVEDGARHGDSVMYEYKSGNEYETHKSAGKRNLYDIQTIRE